MLLLSETEIHTLLTPADALEAMRAGFAAHHAGRVEKPDIIALAFPGEDGEVHAKASYIHGTPDWAVKVASLFPGNIEAGLATHGGLSLVFSATTGYLEAMLLDNGYLTELRTGAAGALAADLMARPDASSVAVIGAGSQALFQLEALLNVRRVTSVRVFARRAAHVERFALDIRTRFGVTAEVCRSARDAVTDADIVVTATSSCEPVVHGEWLAPGTHVTAVGADTPGKRELDRDCLARAATIAVDDLGQARTVGELQYAAVEATWDPAKVVTLGAVQSAERSGRARDSDITVADLTGVGFQDAAIASLAYARARGKKLGKEIRVAGLPDEVMT
ncbi:ornithine cyclodeaminase family protein [Nonomuraea sp. LPB2021202275-12-8]|uniref:ornithine cyclodeaminase family protein n=1 Tax=Nonomuraea sp. LPB2021202275-12-8 TaxID=3120159 RepID=UPI00300CA64A